MLVGSDEPVEEQLRALEATAAAAVFTTEDRRKVLRVTVAGTGRIRDVQLAPRWLRSMQAQRLDAEVIALLRQAGERADDAFHGACVEAGLGAAVSGPDVFVNGLAQVPAGADLLRRLATEVVSEERARGRIVAEFFVSGLLSSLRINTRYATEAEPEELATEIRNVLRAGEGAADLRRAELAAELTEGRTAEEVMSEQVDRFRRKMDELADRLP